MCLLIDFKYKSMALIPTLTEAQSQVHPINSPLLSISGRHLLCRLVTMIVFSHNPHSRGLRAPSLCQESGQSACNAHVDVPLQVGSLCQGPRGCQEPGQDSL